MQGSSAIQPTSSPCIGYKEAGIMYAVWHSHAGWWDGIETKRMWKLTLTHIAQGAMLLPLLRSVKPFAAIVWAAIKRHPLVGADGLPVLFASRNLLLHLQIACTTHIVNKSPQLRTVFGPVAAVGTPCTSDWIGTPARVLFTRARWTRTGGSQRRHSQRSEDHVLGGRTS